MQIGYDGHCSHAGMHEGGGGDGAEVVVAVSRFSSHLIMDPADLDQNLFAIRINCVLSKLPSFP
jgi:hypothetical protein